MKKSCNLFFFLLSIYCFSQNPISGKIEYETYITNHNTDKAKERFQMFLNDFVYTMKIKSELLFNNNESIYKSHRILKTEDEIQNNATTLFLSFTKTKGIYYFNKNKKEKLHFLNAFGQDFIIKKNDSIQWKITKESKLIKGYLCFKAESNVKIINAINNNAKKKVIAWFTPQIPLTLGPAEYSGLPGLILEINVPSISFSYTIKSTKIDIQNKNPLSINKPKKGKVVSIYEFENISKELFKNGKFNID